MLFRALDLAKKEGSKKVPVNFQVYPELKDEFEKLCKTNNVSITAMLTGLMEASLEEAKGIYFHLDVNTLMQINQRILEIEKEMSSMCNFEDGLWEMKEEFRDSFSEEKYNSLESEKLRLERIVRTNQNGGVNDESISQLQSTILNMHDLIEKGVDETDVGFNPVLIKQAAENKLRNIAGIEPENY